MKNKMTRWGIGPKFAFLSIVYSIVILFLHFIYFHNLIFVIVSKNINIIIGIIFITLGIPVFLLSAFSIDKYFEEGKLCTEGVYAFIRHPIYGAWIVFIVPGITLILSSILGITIPLFMYFVFNKLIVNEENYLEKLFGQEYLEYKKNVGAIFPKLWKLKG